MNLGTVGVLLFFCISGYVISLSTNGVKKYRNAACVMFSVRRIFRLLPTYLILSVFMWFFATDPGIRAAISGQIHDDPVWYSVRFVTLMSGFWDDRTAVGGLEWTLGYEVTFYAACSLYLLFWEKFRNPLWIVPIGAILCVLTLLPVGVANNKPQIFAIRYSFFYLGIIVYMYKFNIIRKSVFISVFGTVSACIILRMILVSLAYGRLYSETLAAPIAIMLFGACMLFLKRPPQVLARIGLVSYSVYLCHPAIPMTIPALWLPQPVRPIAWGLLSLAVATLSYTCLEKRFIRYGRNISETISEYFSRFHSIEHNHQPTV